MHKCEYFFSYLLLKFSQPFFPYTLYAIFKILYKARPSKFKRKMGGQVVLGSYLKISLEFSEVDPQKQTTRVAIGRVFPLVFSPHSFHCSLPTPNSIKLTVASMSLNPIGHFSPHFPWALSSSQWCGPLEASAPLNSMTTVSTDFLPSYGNTPQ